MWRLVLSLFFAVMKTASAGSFLNCKEKFNGLDSDQEALATIVHAHEELKQKFSSECLEILFRRNFMASSEYLIDNYYSGTSIDTEIILKSAANQVQRQQDQVIYKMKRRMLGAKGQEFPKALPIMYWAQSVDDVYVQVKLQTYGWDSTESASTHETEVRDALDAPPCRQSFEREVIFEEDQILVRATCMQVPPTKLKGKTKNKNPSRSQREFDLDRKRDDDKIVELEALKNTSYQLEKMIVQYDSQPLKLFNKVDPAGCSYQWIGDGEVQLKMKKAATVPKYWERLTESAQVSEKEALPGQRMLLRVPVQTWWEMKDKYVDQVEDLALEERQKEVSSDIL